MRRPGKRTSRRGCMSPTSLASAPCQGRRGSNVVRALRGWSRLRGRLGVLVLGLHLDRRLLEVVEDVREALMILVEDDARVELEHVARGQPDLALHLGVLEQDMRLLQLHHSR